MNLLIETEIDAPAERVWELLAHKFADIASWSSTVSASRELNPDEIAPRFDVAASAPVVGRETTSKAGTFQEIIVEYSEVDRMLFFDTDGLPRIMTTGTDRQRVTELGPGRSKVSFDVTMEARFPARLAMPLLKTRMRKTFSLVQDELRIAAEQEA